MDRRVFWGIVALGVVGNLAFLAVLIPVWVFVESFTALMITLAVGMLFTNWLAWTAVALAIAILNKPDSWSTPSSWRTPPSGGRVPDPIVNQ